MSWILYWAYVGPYGPLLDSYGHSFRFHVLPYVIQANSAIGSWQPILLLW